MNNTKIKVLNKINVKNTLKKSQRKNIKVKQKEQNK